MEASKESVITWRSTTSFAPEQALNFSIFSFINGIIDKEVSSSGFINSVKELKDFFKFS